MTIADDTRNTIVQLGQTVVYTPAGADWQAKEIPALITDQPESKTGVSGRPQKVSQIRVSKADVPVVNYQDTFTEADGTVWRVFDLNRIINDRIVGTWRIPVESSVRAKK